MNIFLLIAVLALAVASLSLKKSISAIIAFALMMLILGIYYLTLDERLLGVFQIFIYTGGLSVLMLFGLTLIGTDAPQSQNRPWAAFGAFMLFVLLVVFFWLHLKELHHEAVYKPLDGLFSGSYGDFAIIFALIGSSLLYATVKAVKVLSHKRGKDV